MFGTPSTRRFPAPRAFQETTHRELRSGFASGHRAQVVCAPTGAGKTYLALRVCDEALARGKRVLFVCDRKTLINQTSAAADAYGMPPHGIIQAANPRMALWRPFQIASAQTLAARGGDSTFDVIVIDECHTMYDATKELIESSTGAVIGLSATPFSKGMGKLYSRVINAATMHELVGLGVLTPLRTRTCVRPDMTGAKTTGGEWTAKEAGERGKGIIGDVVREWLDHAESRKTICFAPTVEHARTLVERFMSAGVEARIFTGQTTEQERAELLEEYRRPDSRIRVLVSVEALAKGFDVPDVGCVVDCRPLRKSLSTFVQMVGRGLRASPGKTECLLLDHSGNVVRFRKDFESLYFNGLAELDKGEKLDATIREDPEEGDEEFRCPACGFSPMTRQCMACGYEAPRRPSLIEHAEGASVEFKFLGNGPGSYAGSLSELWAMLCYHEQARFERRGAGKPSGAAWHRFRELTGRKPGRDLPRFEAAAAMGARPSEALTRKLRSMDIAFAKGRRRG